MPAARFDVFISHSGADKLGFVEVLTDRLRRAGVRVWYDDYEVGWGASISESIGRGLAECRYGIVVLSRSFLAGGWSRHELRGLWQREVHDGPVILPILHDISLEEVRAFDPSLADRRALDTAREGLEEIVDHVLRFLRGGAAGTPRQVADPLDVGRLADLAAMEHAEVLRRLERYTRAARLTPGSGEVVLGLGLVQLHLRRYSEAVESLAAAVRLLPVSASAHVYHAVSLLRGRRPRSLPLSEARRILEALGAAASLDPDDARPDLLSLVIKHEYFRANGLRIPPPDVADHLHALGEKRVEAAELAALRGVLHERSLLDALVR